MPTYHVHGRFWLGEDLAGLRHHHGHLGLGYLSSERPTGTISGGESQRAKMIRHPGSPLTDVTYVFDELRTGLPPHDVRHMNELSLELRDNGNTVLVAEHKPQIIAIADRVVDLGPGAGTGGGTICFAGTVDELRGSDTNTGCHFNDQIAFEEVLRTSTGRLEIRGAGSHNLDNVDVDIPPGVLTVITGGADSGKRSLVHGSLPGNQDIACIDQSAIRGSRRGNPATSTGLLDSARKTFAQVNEEKPALFSPDSEGACPMCKGAGVLYGPGHDGGRHLQV